MIAIAGGPRAGKTTLAVKMAQGLPAPPKGKGAYKWEDHKTWCTDDITGLGWSERSAHVSKWFDDPEVELVEGVVVPRALRKWLKRNPKGKPCDKVIYLRGAHVELSPGQERMSKGCWTVFEEIQMELAERGVVVEIRMRGVNIMNGVGK